jgi:hypothetical protein
MPHVFVSYVREDADKVATLVDVLKVNGVDVWLDRPTHQSEGSESLA